MDTIPFQNWKTRTLNLAFPGYAACDKAEYPSKQDTLTQSIAEDINHVTTVESPAILTNQRFRQTA